MTVIPPGLYPWLRSTYTSFSGNQKLHHAILFRSAKGLGVEQLVARMVELRHCVKLMDSPAGKKACGDCQHCLLHASGTHPDYIVLAPLAGKAQVSIEQIRACSAKVVNKGLLSPYRLVQIRQAHLMTVSAANALLKMLEEPPKGVYFYLSTDQPALLPATILSRCLQHTIATPNTLQTLGWLNRQLDVEITETQLNLVDGSPLNALALAQQDGFSPLQEILDHYVIVLQKFEDKDSAIHCLQYIECLRGQGKELDVNQVLNLMQWLHRVVLKQQLHMSASNELGLDQQALAPLLLISKRRLIMLDSAITELKQQIILNNGVNVLLQLQQVIVNCAKHV